MNLADRPKILVVDDNPRVRSFLRPALEDAGYDCLEAGDGWVALELVETEVPDLLVLDIGLGDDRMTGLDVCKKLREDGYQMPVVILTIRDRVEYPHSMEQAFFLGADDYVTKRDEIRRLEERMGLTPTEVLERKSDVEELVARIKARLPNSQTILELDDYLRIDLVASQVYVNRGETWREEYLAPKEFAILELLVKNGGRPVGKGQIIYATDIEGEGSLQNHIYKLRQKLEPDPQENRYILTYHRIGYRFNLSKK